jgi:hypothetical protein
MKPNSVRLLIAAALGAVALMVMVNVRAQMPSVAKNDSAVSLTSLGIAAPAQTPAAATAASQEKTVEQTHKNIQVLKGLPDSQLGTVMNYVAVSMGRQCNFCHVRKGNDWVWESDDKEEKVTARSMMKMVLAINKDNFRGNPSVSCYTCHRGRNQPASIPTFPLPTPPPRPQPAAPPVAGQPTPAPTPSGPTADQIVAKYIDAIGGQAAIDKMKTRVMKGTYAGFNGTELPFEAFLTAPDKFYVSVTTTQGTSERGFDGTVAWEKNARGVNELRNPVLDQMKSMFMSFRNIKLKEEFASFRLGGRDKIGDHDVLIVSGRTADNHRERLFFDTATGLLLRRITYLETMIGVIPEQTDFEDYRDVDGVKLPFIVKVSAVEPGLVSTRKYTEIKLNVPVDESKFKMPQAAKPATP